MEIYIILGAFTSLILLIFMLVDSMSKAFKGFTISFILIYVLSIGLWFNMTEEVHEPIEIKTVVTDDYTWQYYRTHNGDIIEIPNNVDGIVKINQRWGILSEPTYKLIYK